MKKITIFVLMTLILANFVDFGHANADSDSEAYGFFVDSDRYGTHKDLEIAEEYTIHNTKYGDYIIGYSRLVVLVYEDQTDSDWASVVIQSTAYPKDVYMKGGLFGRLKFTDMTTLSQNIHSDVDSGFKNWGYSYYTDASLFEMEQPSPMLTISSTTYRASIEFSATPKIQGEVTFDIKELSLLYGHKPDTEIFDVTYKYSCNFLDCSYRDGMTYNKATFLVNMTKNASNAGIFVNDIYLATTFRCVTGYPLFVEWTTDLHVNTLYF